MQKTERLGDRFGMLAGMLNVVADRFTVGTQIDHDIVVDDPVVD